MVIGNFRGGHHITECSRHSLPVGQDFKGRSEHREHPERYVKAHNKLKCIIIIM